MNQQFVNQQKGITLIEILIVLAIIGAAMSLVIGNFNPGSREIRRELRRLPVLSREIYQQAQISNKIYRLVINMPPGELHSYHVEFGKSESFIPDEGEKPELDEEGNEISNYQIDKEILKEPLSLPEDFVFRKISYGNRDGVFTEGKAYIYYFPQGLSEEAVIHIARRDDKLNWTLVSNPLTGKIDILEGVYDDKQISQE